TSYRARYLSILGRLKPDVSLLQAQLRMTTLQHQLWREPTSVANGYDVRVRQVAEVLTGRARPSLLILFGAVGLMLLVACANIANLMLVRAAGRQRETAVRLALGASPGQLARLLLAESLLLSAVGAVCAVLVAWGSLVGLRDLRPDLPRIDDAALTPAVLAFTSGIAIVAALLFSLAPIVALRQSELRGSMNDGGRSGSGSIAAARMRKLLVASQMALASVLLVSGGLLLRSLDNLLRVDTGFRASNAGMFDVYLPSSRYLDAAQQTRFYRDLVRELGETQGVQSAGGLLYFPYKPKLWLSSVWIDDAPVPDGEQPVVYYNLAAGDYFKAMGIPLKAGRWLTEREVWEDPRPIVVNEALARQIFPTRSPIGRRIRSGADGPWHEIVGIVGDVRQKQFDEAPKPEFYETFAEIRRGGNQIDRLRIVRRIFEVDRLPVAERRDLSERLVAALPVVIGDRRHELGVERRRVFADDDETIGIVEGQPIEQHCLQRAEHRRVRANRQRQRQHDDQAEAGSGPQAAPRVAKVETQVEQFLSADGHVSLRGRSGPAADEVLVNASDCSHASARRRQSFNQWSPDGVE
ncbi:MAG: FtsX-like permease family protein, partial [Vicinamibacterales bacterium]